MGLQGSSQSYLGMGQGFKGAPRPLRTADNIAPAAPSEPNPPREGGVNTPVALVDGCESGVDGRQGAPSTRPNLTGVTAATSTPITLPNLAMGASPAVGAGLVLGALPPNVNVDAVVRLFEEYLLKTEFSANINSVLTGRMKQLLVEKLKNTVIDQAKRGVQLTPENWRCLGLEFLKDTIQTGVDLTSDPKSIESIVQLYGESLGDIKPEIKAALMNNYRSTLEGQVQELKEKKDGRWFQGSSGKGQG